MNNVIRNNVSNFKSSRKWLATLVLCATAPVINAAVLTNIGGEVERIIVDNPLDTWSRGTIVVSGRNIIIPANMVFDLPANRLTLQQLFVNAPSACSADTNSDGIPDQTGLAKGDSCNNSGTGAAISMIGNKTNAGDLIAGEVMIEKKAESVSGVVTFINYDQGYFRINGIVGDDTTGAMIRINDPEGRHTDQVGAGCAGSASNCSADTRYGVDPDNYTFTASTGYPMCIPSTVSRTFTFDTDNNGVIDPVTETNIVTAASTDGSGDLLCPQTNRTAAGIPVGDSRLFAPVQLGDHVGAEGNFENIGGVVFLSAHTAGVSEGLITADSPLQPDYMVFDEVGWDVPGYQNKRVRDLLIGFTTLANPGVDIFALYGNPATSGFEEKVFATTVGCEIAAGAGTCSSQGILGNIGIFKVVHDVDFVLGAPVEDRRSPCKHLNAAMSIGGGGIPDANGTLMFNSPCSATPTIGEEFAVLAPATRDIIGRSRHKHALLPSVVTLDFHGMESQNGEYLNPVGIGHPEFVEIDLAALDTAYIFAGEQWNMDRRLGPGGCDATLGCEDPATTPIGDASMALDPFPFSGLEPGTQAGPLGALGAVPVAPGYTLQRDRPMAYWPFLNATQVFVWPPIDPVAQGILPTDHVLLLQCSAP